MSKIGEAIKSLPLKREPAKCAEWAEAAGQPLYVRELTGAERGEWEQVFANNKKDALKSLRARIVAQSLVTEDGESVFDGPKDVQGLSSTVVARVSDQALRLSGLAEDAIEDAVGNSEGGPNDESS